MREVKTERLEAFFAAFLPAYLEAVEKHPDEYAGMVREDIPAAAQRMKAAIIKGSYNHDGRSFKGTCKALGIKHTRKAIEAYLTGQ